MTTFSGVTYQEFKQSASILFQSINSEDYSIDQVESGEKALQLMYLGRDSWSELEEHEAKTILYMVTDNIIQVRAHQMRL